MSNIVGRGSKTTKEVTMKFFRVIFEVLSKNSSKKYAFVALKNMQKRLAKEFKFFKLIKIGGGKIVVHDAINSIGARNIKNLFIKIIDLLGPDFLKLLIREKMDSEDIKFLNRIGVRV